MLLTHLKLKGAVNFYDDKFYVVSSNEVNDAEYQITIYEDGKEISNTKVVVKDKRLAYNGKIHIYKNTITFFLMQRDPFITGEIYGFLKSNDLGKTWKFQNLPSCRGDMLFEVYKDKFILFNSSGHRIKKYNLK